MMKHNGLAKLIEECGETIQIAGKMLQYPELQYGRTTTHPDGTNLLDRLESELGDLLAAIKFTREKLGLDPTAIELRKEMKLALYHQWDKNDD